MRLHFNRRPVESVAALIDAYHEAGELKSPTRSTVPLLSLLKHERQLWRLIAEGLHGDDCDVHGEFEVESWRGGGNPSQTDMMLRCAGASLAIEAKWTESKYRTVKTRIERDRHPAHAQDVVGYWASLLERYLDRGLRIRDLEGVDYQMLHRAASACAAGRPAAMSYLKFTPSPDRRAQTSADLGDALARFHALLGSPEALPFKLVEVRIEPTESFARIASMRSRNPATSNAIRAALLTAPLFDFAEARVLLALGEGQR